MRTRKIRSKFRFFKRFEIKMTYSFDIVCRVVCFTVSSLLKAFRTTKCFGEFRFRDVLKKRNLERISFALNYSLIKIFGLLQRLLPNLLAPAIVPLPPTKMSPSPPL